MQAKDGIGGRLKQARKALKLTQQAIADLLGSALGSWQEYEAGKKVPGGLVIAGLVKLGINANWVLTSDGPMTLKELHAERFDVETLEQAVKVLETRLKLGNKTMTPEGKAKVLVGIYELLNSEGDEKSRASVILELLTHDF